MDRDDFAPGSSGPLELEEIAEQPGTYYNPRTEMTLVVDDSGSIDQAVLPPAGEGADWVRVSEEPAIDEQLRDEVLDRFESGIRSGREESIDTVTLEPDGEGTGDEDDDEDGFRPTFDPGE